MQILLKTRALINRTGKYCGRRRLARAGTLVLNGGHAAVSGGRREDSGVCHGPSARGDCCCDRLSGHGWHVVVDACRERIFLAVISTVVLIKRPGSGGRTLDVF
jgi:hypothetical protein